MRAVTVWLLAQLAVCVMLAACTKPKPRSPFEAPTKAPELRQIKVTPMAVTLPAEAKTVAPAQKFGPELSFEDDVTIPDRTKVRPGAKFTKVWRLANRYTRPVPAHAIRLSKEDSFGPIAAPEAIWLPSVDAGKQIEVKAEMEIKADAPEGLCRAQYMGDPTAGVFLGPFCLVEIDRNAPPLDQQANSR